MIDALMQLYVLIKKFEGCRLTAYLCPAGVWTVGWGSTGVDVRPGVVWTQEHADERMYKEALHFARGALALCPRLVESDSKWCAIADFAYNCGLGNLQSSTLRRVFNAGNDEAAAEQFGRWVYGGGKVLPGLVARRAAEKALFAS